MEWSIHFFLAVFSIFGASVKHFMQVLEIIYLFCSTFHLFPDKTKEPSLLVAPPGLYAPSGGPPSISASGLGSSSGLQFGSGPGKAHRPMITPMMLQQPDEEDRWLARPRALKVEKVDRQGQVLSEFPQQVREKRQDLGRHTEPTERLVFMLNDFWLSFGNTALFWRFHSTVVTSFRYSAHHNDVGVRDQPQPLGAPPPLISPKPQARDHRPSPPTLWNPVSLINSDRPLSHIHPFSRHTKPKPQEDESRQQGASEKTTSMPINSLLDSGKYLAELEKSTRSFLSQQRNFFSQSGFRDYGQTQGSGSHRPAVERSDPMMVYDQALQQHRRLVSKLDLEERKRREAREKGV